LSCRDRPPGRSSPPACRTLYCHPERPEGAAEGSVPKTSQVLNCHPERAQRSRRIRIPPEKADSSTPSASLRSLRMTSEKTHRTLNCHPERVAERSEFSNPMPAGGRHTMIFAEGAAEGSASPIVNCQFSIVHSFRIFSRSAALYKRSRDRPPGRSATNPKSNSIRRKTI